MCLISYHFNKLFEVELGSLKYFSRFIFRGSLIINAVIIKYVAVTLTKIKSTQRIIEIFIKEPSHFTRPKNELFLGIFHTTPVIDIHMILSELDKSTLEVYEKKNVNHFT